MESRLYVEEKLRALREKGLERRALVEADLRIITSEKPARLQSLLAWMLIRWGRWLSSLGQGGIAAGEALLKN